MIDVLAVRADTPAVNDLVHLNNAGAALPPEPVTRATLDYLRAEAAGGGYETVDERTADLDRVYVEGARMFGCAESEVAFQVNASQAWWAAFNSVPLQPGDRVLASSVEYVANALGLLRARRAGVQIELIPDDEHGQTSVEALVEMLDERVKLVCITHVPTSGGLVNPAAAIGAAVKEHSNALYLLDACQSAGQMPLVVDELRCDFLSLTGRKFLRGPRGTGLLYQRSGIEGLVDPLLMDGHGVDWTGPWNYEVPDGPRRHELFEYNFAAKAGFGVALAYANDLGLDAIWARVTALADQLRVALSNLDGVTVADQGAEQCGIVTFDIAGHEPDGVVAELRRRRINTSGAMPRASQFDLADRAPNGLVRASVHYYNDESDLNALVDAVLQLTSG